MRMRHVAAALSEAGHQVCLLTGGVPPDNKRVEYSVVQLPPLRTAPGNFAELLNADMQPVDRNFLRNRTQIMAREAEMFSADVVLIETYPFGRKQLRNEINTLLDVCKEQTSRPLVVCSIRDVLQQKTVDREYKIVDIIKRDFDLVFVHGDADWIPLQHSFSLAGEIAEKIHYTGYIDDRDGQSRSGSDGHQEVIVSAGGGAVAAPLVTAAIDAAKHDQSGMTWRILVGSSITADQRSHYQHLASSNTIVESNRSDFPHLLSHCAVSVSQAGYNTCMDILRSGSPSVLVPYAEDGETEQLQRAKVLAEKQVCLLLEQADLTAHSLLTAVNNQRNQPVKKVKRPDMNGAIQTVGLLEQHFKTHKHTQRYV